MGKNNKENQAKKAVDKQEEIADNKGKVADVEQDSSQEPTHEELLAQEKDRYLRLFAEFENYKRRNAKERIDLFKTANRDLMTVLLPILDDFERGLAEIKKQKDDDLLKGMQLIYDKFKKTLEQQGLTQMKVKKGDTFDADIHQAITQIPAPKKKWVGKIIDTVEQGYRLGDVIIRYPKVVVGK